MIIAQDTDVLVLDEPTTFLDINYQLEIFDIIKKLRDSGKTIILVIHDLQQAFSFSDEIVLLHCGQVINIGSSSKLVEDSNIAKIFKVKIEKCYDTDAIYSYNLKYQK